MEHFLCAMRYSVWLSVLWDRWEKHVQKCRGWQVIWDSKYNSCSIFRVLQPKFNKQILRKNKFLFLWQIWIHYNMVVSSLSKIQMQIEKEYFDMKAKRACVALDLILFAFRCWRWLKWKKTKYLRVW